MKLRVTTFNVENLFNRYAFLDQPWSDKNYEKFVMATSLASIASRKGDLVPYTTTPIQRTNTALAIQEADPDVLVLNEIENLYTLRIFNSTFLDGAYDRMISVDGNDPRGIDVGLMIKKGVKAKVLAVRTHVDDPLKGKTISRQAVANFGYQVKNAIYSRDCLEVDLEVGGKVLTVMANHLKAQDSNPAKSRARRRGQAEAVAELVDAAVAAGKLPIVLGDMNTDPLKNPGDKSIDPLLTHASLKDPFAGDSASARWTHFYESDKSVSRLDYILVHSSLKVSGTKIVRNGLSTKCTKYGGPRFQGIGPAHTEASDHCPVTVVLDV